MQGNKRVEQIDIDGNTVIDYDTTLSPSEVYKRIKDYFPNINKDEDGMIVGNYNGEKYSIRAKNITYLGNPHPIYKKRIQISNDLSEFYKTSIKKGYKPVLLGVYTYKDNHIFCGFKIEDYVNKKAHNSSAHVMTDDIAAAVLDKYFQKVDYFKNNITVFSGNAVNTFLDELFSDDSNYETIEISRNKQEKTISKEVIETIVNFFTHEEKEWNGIDCYREMIGDDYRNKYQPEWAGFYLEYTFEKYLKNNSLSRLITYAQDKKKGGIDLDLYFPETAQYGDLKAHSNHSKAIQGNDWDTIEQLIKEGKHIYYIVCEHSTQKDVDYDFEVTQYWNKAQNKSNLLSYSKRMKHSVKLTAAYILDINHENYKYLSKFKQGINANGKPREPKIMIDMDNIEHFIIKKIPL